MTNARACDMVAFVNNSRETFTPTVSGAIATCVQAVGREALLEGYECPVITRQTDAEPNEWPSLHFTSAAREHGPATDKLLRARRRLNGWARPDQWVYAREVLSVLRHLEPRVVVVNNDPEIAVFLREHLPSAAVVHWFHNLELSSDRFRRRYAADPALRSVAVSGYLARAVEQVYRLTPLSVAPVLNGVDCAAFTSKRTSTLPTIGFLGRVAVEKAPDTLVRACLLLARRSVDFRLQFAGDTNWGRSNPNPFTDRLDALLSELGDAGVEVVRTGHLPRRSVPAALAASDIHVVPSRWDEPCGLTTLEGMASGQAVVGSATGGTPEVLVDAGLLFPRDNHEALADILEQLLLEPDARRAWGDRARRRAESLTWQRTWHGLATAAGLAVRERPLA